jgi:hypothetical protein
MGDFGYVKKTYMIMSILFYDSDLRFMCYLKVHIHML